MHNNIQIRLIICALQMYKVNTQKKSPPAGLEPATFRLTAERANQLRHGGL